MKKPNKKKLAKDAVEMLNQASGRGSQEDIEIAQDAQYDIVTAVEKLLKDAGYTQEQIESDDMVDQVTELVQYVPEHFVLK